MGGITNPENTDNRTPGEWQSKYEGDAMNKIFFEARYLVFTYSLAPILSLIIWLDLPLKWFDLDPQVFLIIKKYSLVFFGGVFGGTIFDIKWLVHAVAKRKWHMDRRLWRLLVPLTSGAFSLAFATLISSGFLKIFDPNSLQSPATAFGFGFLVGYFSDNAIAKLSEVAQTLFGTLEDRNKPKNNNQPPSSSDS